MSYENERSINTLIMRFEIEGGLLSSRSINTNGINSLIRLDSRPFLSIGNRKRKQKTNIGIMK